MRSAMAEKWASVKGADSGLPALTKMEPFRTAYQTVENVIKDKGSRCAPLCRECVRVLVYVECYMCMCSSF